FPALVTASNGLSPTTPFPPTSAPSPYTPPFPSTPLPSGTVNQAYSATLAATGGTPPYSWAIASGALPPGLSLNANGAISGTPTTAGDFDFTARVTDSKGLSATGPFRITISAAPTP